MATLDHDTGRVIDERKAPLRGTDEQLEELPEVIVTGVRPRYPTAQQILALAVGAALLWTVMEIVPAQRPRRRKRARARRR